MVIYDVPNIGQEVYTCNICEKMSKFKWKPEHQNKFEHYETLAEADDMFTCEICEKSFVEKSKLHDHVRNIHIYKEEKTCDNYKEMHENKGYQEKHIQNAKFTCKDCRKIIKTNQGLKEHIWRLHKKHIEESFGCDDYKEMEQYTDEDCTENFTSKRTKNLHVKCAHRIDDVINTDDGPNRVDRERLGDFQPKEQH